MSVPELKDNPLVMRVVDIIGHPVGDGIINCADFETYHNEREEVRFSVTTFLRFFTV